MPDDIIPTSPVLDDDETKDSGSEGAAAETEDDENEADATEDEVQTSDYDSEDDEESDESEEDENTLKKRYVASSKESIRLKHELEAKQKEIDDWVELVKSDDELKALVAKKTGKGMEDDKEVKRLREEVEALKQERRLDTIQRFEAGKIKLGYKFTPDVRRKIGTLAKDLEKRMPFSEALDLAFLHYNRKTVEQRAEATGKNKGLIDFKINSEATSTTSNSSAGQGSKSYRLTKEEQAYVESMPGSDKEKQEFIEFHLASKRK